jgi:hypothetical protein
MLPGSTTSVINAASSLQGDGVGSGLQHKQELLQLSQELLGQLWSRLVNWLSESATVMVFRSALTEVRQQYAALEVIQVGVSGVALKPLENQIETLDETGLRLGLLKLMESLMALLADLTGEVLIKRVEPVVEPYRQRLTALSEPVLSEPGLAIPESYAAS